MERPTRTVEGITQLVESANADDEAVVGIGVNVATYRENPDPSEEPYSGNDGVCFQVIATANTRKGIDYDYTTVPISPYWVEATEPTHIIGDNSGAWIDLPFGVIFYGGPGAQNNSGIYEKVWVCSNGFLSFDSSSTSSGPVPVPNPMPPNTMIAPYWADLDPTGGSITYYADLIKFVVEWKDVLNKDSGERQTFEVVILNDHSPHFRGQNRIFLLYQSVTFPQQASGDEIVPLGIPPDPPFVAQGIEDQEGYKGTRPSPVESGYGIQFTAMPFSSPEIREIDILMSKADSNARLYVDRNPWSVSGANIPYHVPQPDPQEPPLFVNALQGGTVLLMSTVIGYLYGPVGGILFGVTRIAMGLAEDYYAQSLQAADPLCIQDEWTSPGTDFCYVNTSALAYAPPYDYPVDASLGTQVYWVFLDDNTLDHEVTLTARLKYYSNMHQAFVAIETSVTLNAYIGTPSIPIRPSGQTSGNKGISYTYNTTTTTPDGDSIYYQFDWDDGTNTTIGPHPSGIIVSASHSWTSARSYDVRVRAKDASYESWSDWSPTLPVSIVNREPYVPSKPSGRISGYTYSAYDYYAVTTDPDGDDVRYEFSWGDGTTNTTGWHASGINASASHSWSSAGIYLVQARAQDADLAWSDWSLGLSVTITGGGCPYVSTWNGTDYVLDNNLLPASVATGSDVVDYYFLEQPSVPSEDGTYRLLISEFGNEHSFLDYVQLVAVDHLANVNVAVSPYGEILTYTEPASPVSAITDSKKNVKHLLGAIDDDYYLGCGGSYVTLNFGDDLDLSEGARLVMRADLPPLHCKWSVHIQILNEVERWATVAIVIPRAYWATEIVDLSDHLPDAKGNLKVRLYFTADHKIDFVGLDTSRQAAIASYEGQLISATHSTIGDVTTQLASTDEMYAQIIPDQGIVLQFTLPRPTMETRDYLIIVKGHYYRIA